MTLPRLQPDFRLPSLGDDPILTDSVLHAGDSIAASAMNVLNSYALVFVAAFIVTLLATPIVRRIAVAADVIDHPDETRKMHRYPVAYLGGIAVFLGLVVAIGLSYVSGGALGASHRPMPFAVLIGMIAITFTGFADDVWGWDPRLKIAGQLVAAAALAIEDVGVRVAEGLLAPMLGAPESVLFTLGGMELLNGHVYYWIGTALIAIFVLGGCNSANLIDGLDGLLSGVTGIVAIGLLAIALLMLAQSGGTELEAGQSLAVARVVLALAVLGAVCGFLPHNFNPASIFLGDCGSLLLGYCCAVIILMLGDRGQTHIVLAGLIVFALPIMDTTLAIIRRTLSGRSLSEADDQHLHHQLKRSLGGVKRAVLAMYGIGIVFGVVGVALAALVMFTELRVRVIYAIVLVLFGSIGMTAVKAARQKQQLIPVKKGVPVPPAKISALPVPPGPRAPSAAPNAPDEIPRVTPRA